MGRPISRRNAWLNFCPLYTHATIQHVMSLAALYLGPTNGVIFEWGNEHWNFGGSEAEYFWEWAAYRFTEYLPSGTSFLTYMTTNGQPVGGSVNGNGWTYYAACVRRRWNRR